MKKLLEGDGSKRICFTGMEGITEINKFPRKGKELLGILFNGKLNNLEALFEQCEFFVDVVLYTE
jgi:hypothetical protein